MPEDNQSNEPNNEFPQELSSSEAEPTTAPVIEETVPAPQPQAAPTIAATSSRDTSKKKLIIGGALAAFLVVVFGGGALAYNIWYQNPDKVLADGFAHLVMNTEDMHSTTVVEASTTEAKIKVDADLNATKDVDGGTAKLTLEFGGGMKALGTVSTNANFVLTKDKGYFKLNNVKETVTKVIDAYMDEVAKQYETYGLKQSTSELEKQKQAAFDQLNPIIEKIDNRWVKADLSKNKDEDTACLLNAFSTLKNNKDQQKQVGEAYRSNKFITVKEKLGAKNGSLGYKLGYDKAKSDAFGDALEKTDFAKAVKKCQGETATNTTQSSSNDPLKNITVEVWVSRWSHQITRIAAAGESNEDNQKVNFTFDTTLDYMNVDVPTEPKDAVDVNTLSNEVESLFMGASSTSSTSAASTI